MIRSFRCRDTEALFNDQDVRRFRRIERVARRIALNIQSTLLGDDPGSLPIAFSVKSRLMINMTTARAIGISPSFEVLRGTAHRDRAPAGEAGAELE